MTDFLLCFTGGHRHPITTVSLILTIGLASTLASADELGISTSYNSDMSSALITSKATTDDTYEDSEAAMALAYEALSSAISSLKLAYEASGSTTVVADLGWSGTYGCKNYYVNEDGDKVYAFGDYTEHYLDGVEPYDKKSLTVSASLVSGLDSSGDWTDTADCSLKSLVFDNY